MRRFGLIVLLSLYVVIRALDMWSYPLDDTVDEVMARVEITGDCFDGTNDDYQALQWHYAPRIIRYGCDA